MKKYVWLLLAVLLPWSLTSCSKDDDPVEEEGGGKEEKRQERTGYQGESGTNEVKEAR